MPSRTDICNQALSRIGIKKQIALIDSPTERSEEAIQCRLWESSCRQVALQAYDWNCARRRQALALTGGTAPTNWTYEYAYPANCLAVRCLVLPGVPWPRKDQKSGVTFEAGYSGSVRVIYSDTQNAEAIFTFDLLDYNGFPPSLISAIVYLLASEIAIPLSLKPDMAAQARQAYGLLLRSASMADANEGETGPEPANEYESYRNA